MASETLGPLARHNARISGSGSTRLIFAHGFGCDQTVWRDVLPDVEARHQVVVFDHAGAGGCHPSAYSDHRHGSLTGYAQDVIALCEALGPGPRVMVAHSVSCMIVAEAAILRPDLFDLIVMIGPSACYVNDGAYVGGFDRRDLEDFLDLLERNFQGWGRALAALAMGNPDRPELTQGLGDRICRTDPAVAGVFARVTFFSDLRDMMPRVTTPTVVLQCQEDPIAPETATRFVHQALPNSRLVTLQAQGHCPHMSHPAEVSAALVRALADHGLGP